MCKIEKAKPSDLDELFNIYLNAKRKLDSQCIFQWTDSYPSKNIIKNDIQENILYMLKNDDNQILGAVNLSTKQEDEYKQINWADRSCNSLVVHRLVVHTKHQGYGYAKLLMDFSEKFAYYNHFSSIRLDAYSLNKIVVDFYKKRNYITRGQVFFPQRAYPFLCMEKHIVPLK